MKKALFLIGAVALATASIPAAQASGCYDRPDGSRYCSAAGGSGGFYNPSQSRFRHPRADSGLNLYGEKADRSGSVLTCYNIAGKPYTYRGTRCPIS